MTFRDLIIEAIADMYSTSVEEVTRDVESVPGADEYLDQFCLAMEGAGY